jgi:hypothetical protein
MEKRGPKGRIQGVEDSRIQVKGNKGRVQGVKGPRIQVKVKGND